MDEVARAAEISRQGLYLHFATKEELFRALVAHMLGTCFADAEAVLRDPALPLEQKLAGAFGEWMGRHVGLVGKDAADLIQAAHSLMGDEIREFEKRNLEAITKTLRKTDIAAAYAARGITTRQLAAHLLAIARGLKCHCASPEDFRQEFALSLKILFSVLGTK
jgi:AcrR family transcriptional regulator